jgi:hypothetical protein
VDCRDALKLSIREQMTWIKKRKKFWKRLNKLRWRNLKRTNQKIKVKIKNLELKNRRSKKIQMNLSLNLNQRKQKTKKEL